MNWGFLLLYGWICIWEMLYSLFWQKNAFTEITLSEKIEKEMKTITAFQKKNNKIKWYRNDLSRNFWEDMEGQQKGVFHNAAFLDTYHASNWKVYLTCILLALECLFYLISIVLQTLQNEKVVAINIKSLEIASKIKMCVFMLMDKFYPHYPFYPNSYNWRLGLMFNHLRFIITYNSKK